MIRLCRSSGFFSGLPEKNGGGEERSLPDDIHALIAAAEKSREER